MKTSLKNPLPLGMGECQIEVQAKALKQDTSLLNTLYNSGYKITDLISDKVVQNNNSVKNKM